VNLDTEWVPLLEEGKIEGSLTRKVLPYAPDAWLYSDFFGLLGAGKRDAGVIAPACSEKE